MFIDNKYSNWYFNIINNVKLLQRNKQHPSHPNYIYLESHHIIPKCLGGNNDKSNLVLLTAREHFIVHILLLKMVNCKNHKFRLLKSLLYFKGNNSKSSRIINSRLYEIYRKQYSIEMRNRYNKENDSIRRNKISIAMKNIWKTGTRYNFHMTTEHATKIGKLGSIGRKHKYQTGELKYIPKKKKVYKNIEIERNNITKIIKQNQYSSYSKLGWIQKLCPTPER